MGKSEHGEAREKRTRTERGMARGHMTGAGSCVRWRSRACRIGGLVACTLLVTLASSAAALAAAPAWELTSIHAPTNVPLTPTVNQRDSLTVQGALGKLLLEVGEASTVVKFNAAAGTPTAAELQAKLEKLQPIGKNNVTVSGGPADEFGTKPYVIEFIGQLAGHGIELNAEVEEPSKKEEEEIEALGGQEGEAEDQTTRQGTHAFVDYRLLLTNAGGAPSAGTITVTDKLPEGVTTRKAPIQAQSPGWNCTPSGFGAEQLTCTTEAVVNPDAPAPPLLIEAYVDATVKEGQQLVNEASVSGGSAANASAVETATVSSTPAPFGVHDFTAGTTDADGHVFTQAGGHPYAATTSFFLNTILGANTADLSSPLGQSSILVPANIKDADVKLPAGFVGNPQALPRCPQAVFTEGTIGGPVLNGSCPPEAQVGGATVYFRTFEGAEKVAVYNLQPPAGVPAEFGFIFDNVPIRLDAHVIREAGANGEYRVTVLSADINEGLNILGVRLSLWGVPADASHNAERYKNKSETGAEDKEAPRPFLTNPTDCVGEADAPPVTTITYDRWESPGALNAQGDPILGDANWLQNGSASPPVTGCQLLSFAPTIAFHPANTQADEPAGFTFGLNVPQNEEPTGLATPELKDTTVTLPAGVSISPSAANGLQACKDAQIQLDSTERGSCPDASQVGSVVINSQLLEKPLNGRVYIGEPQCSPCGPSDAEDGKLFRLFIEAEGSGVRVKLPGIASANTTTGQLTTTFKNNPQLPFETLELTLNNGPRAPLANPQSCGAYTTSADLTPWSRGGSTAGGTEILGTPDALPSFSFAVDWDGSGGACPASIPFSPGFQAGTEVPTAGAYSPFDVTFTRHDREQDLSGITVETPEGLLGKIAGITRCNEADANLGTCPAASRIATATSAAGAGTNPFVVSGPVYLTNGYKGAPFGLSIVVPADAGPFHLGNVIVRAAISINPVTSAITITSDPLPQSRDGVPFRIQTVKVRVDRPEFMFNPTNCEPKSVGATLTGAPVKEGESAVTVHPSAPFTASGCAALPFKPKLTATTQAKTSKANGASLKVKVVQPPGSANIRKVELQLPIILPSRLTTLQKACTEAQFATNPAGCPEASNIGTAVAITPLLSAPLQGPAYLVSHGGAAFPDVVFLLQGEGVHIELTGHTDVKKGITYSRFETVPDAPITSFETNLPEGPHSILAANGNLCAHPVLAPTKIVAQNNAHLVQTTRIAVTGCPSAGRASVRIVRAKVKRNALLVTVKTSKAGTVKITGPALRTTVKRGVGAGTHRIRVRLKASGVAAAKRHARLKTHVSLKAGTQSANTTEKVRA